MRGWSHVEVAKIISELGSILRSADYQDSKGWSWSGIAKRRPILQQLAVLLCFFPSIDGSNASAENLFMLMVRPKLAH